MMYAFNRVVLLPLPGGEGGGEGGGIRKHCRFAKSLSPTLSPRESGSNHRNI